MNRKNQKHIKYLKKEDSSKLVTFLGIDQLGLRYRNIFNLTSQKPFLLNKKSTLWYELLNYKGTLQKRCGLYLVALWQYSIFSFFKTLLYFSMIIVNVIMRNVFVEVNHRPSKYLFYYFFYILSVCVVFISSEFSESTLANVFI